MDRRGFRNYSKEWWHFTLNREPFSGTYFDFPVE
jgi:D-alanyl-D-alanine dipeptidase